MKKYFGVLLILLAVLVSCNEEKPQQHAVNKLPEHTYVIKITTDSVIGWDAKQRCKVEYIQNGKSEFYGAGIKCRGGASSRYSKHSYSLEFDTSVYFCGIGTDDDWILNASYIDKTFQRHKLSYDLFRKMNPEKNIAAKCSYASVYVNGKYTGLYVIMEEVNGSMIGLNKEQDGAVLFKDPLIFFEEKLESVQDSSNYYQQKFPKINMHDQSGYMERVHEIMFEENDELFDELIPGIFDIENIIDWHLLLLLTNNDDGLFKNFYIYQHSDTSKFYFTPWDYDHSFGRDGDGELNMLERNVDPLKVMLLKRLMESKTLGYKEALKERWQQLREENVISVDKLKNMIRENERLMNPYLDDNFQRWPLKSKWYPDENNHGQELEIMKDYIQKRIPQMDEYFQRLV